MINDKDIFKDFWILLLIITVIFIFSNCKSKKPQITQQYLYRIEWREKSKVWECDYTNNFSLIDNGCVIYTNVIGQRTIRCGDFEIIRLKNEDK